MSSHRSIINTLVQAGLFSISLDFNKVEISFWSYTAFIIIYNSFYRETKTLSNLQFGLIQLYILLKKERLCIFNIVSRSEKFGYKIVETPERII